MTTDLVIIGCGGFGREVADIVDAINGVGEAEPAWNLLGFIDDDPTVENTILIDNRGSRVLGSLDAVAPHLQQTAYAIGIGSGDVRQSISKKTDELGLTAATLIHPSATIGANVELLPGAILCAGVRVTTNIKIGRHVHINLNSTVGHDSTIGDFATINPLVAVSGNCTIGALTNLGTHSAVLPGISVGTGAVVGASACVTKDVASKTTVKGVPAR